MRAHSPLEDVNLFELIHGVKFPADYKKYIQDAYAYHDQVFSFVLPGDTDADKRYFEGFFNGVSLGEIRVKFRDEIPNELVAIGSCVDQDFICIGVSGTVRDAVYLYKHSENKPLTEWSHLERITDSFTAFIRNLKREDHETIIQAVTQVFREPFNVNVFSEIDVPDGKQVHVVQTVPSTEHDFVMGSTIGLSDIQSGVPYSDKPIRVEIVGMVSSKHKFPELLPRILASCAIQLMRARSTMPFGPVVICDNVFTHVRSRLEHVLLMPQFLWDDLVPVEFRDKEVRFLLAVPISTREMRYGLKYGFDALNELFVKNEIVVHDLKRKPVV